MRYVLAFFAGCLVFTLTLGPLFWPLNGNLGLPQVAGMIVGAIWGFVAALLAMFTFAVGCELAHERYIERGDYW